MRRVGAVFSAAVGLGTMASIVYRGDSAVVLNFRKKDGASTSAPIMITCRSVPVVGKMAYKTWLTQRFKRGQDASGIEDALRACPSDKTTRKIIRREVEGMMQWLEPTPTKFPDQETHAEVMVRRLLRAAVHDETLKNAFLEIIIAEAVCNTGNTDVVGVVLGFLDDDQKAAKLFADSVCERLVCQPRLSPYLLLASFKAHHIESPVLETFVARWYV
jgi:hypothetical protein